MSNYKQAGTFVGSLNFPSEIPEGSLVLANTGSSRPNTASSNTSSIYSITPAATNLNQATNSKPYMEERSEHIVTTKRTWGGLRSKTTTTDTHVKKQGWI